MLKILVDRSLLALPSDQNQKLAAIPAAEAQRTYGERDWLRHLQSDADRPAPLKVEQTIQQIEAIAGRPRTSSAETKGLVNKVQNTPGIAAGGYFSTESVAKDLLVPQLRQIPGVLSRASNSQPYAVQHLDALRADFEKKKVGLGEQYRAIRQSLLVDAARAGELQSRYLQLRTNLVAPDE